MRMWLINPTLLCKQHLLGEHREMHCAYNAFMSGKYDYEGYSYGLVDFRELKTRHDDLVREMKRRGYNHNDNIKINDILACDCYSIDSAHNVYELRYRCKNCRKLIEEWEERSRKEDL